MAEKINTYLYMTGHDVSVSTSFYVFNEPINTAEVRYSRLNLIAEYGVTPRQYLKIIAEVSGHKGDPEHLLQSIDDILGGNNEF